MTSIGQIAPVAIIYAAQLFVVSISDAVDLILSLNKSHWKAFAAPSLVRACTFIGPTVKLASISYLSSFMSR